MGELRCGHRHHPQVRARKNQKSQQADGRALRHYRSELAAFRRQTEPVCGDNVIPDCKTLRNPCMNNCLAQSTASPASRACPLPQGHHQLKECAIPVGAGAPANTGAAGAMHRVGFFAAKAAPRHAQGA
ncbi:protein of unknown function [Pseudomonas sp. JV551A1]|uniref:Uncharacterized protein n=1 Tax=Pseudomonas inefficax TaxID=2078786 RepID=A0AAQ1P9U0_9PSED|nr:protein of unknown function [Pseudomonas sp. JV551A1]SPO61261.1 protein of unknown function [Pseudomonas inefficax]